MPLRPGLSAGLVQDYLQRSRVQYNITNIQLLGGCKLHFYGNVKVLSSFLI